jgi:hypothetical protein
MTDILEMFREARTARGRNRFSCPLPIWELLWELGRAFGWRATGTPYVMSAQSAVAVPARRDYQPSGSQDHKRVEEQDAVGLGACTGRCEGIAASRVDDRSMTQGASWQWQE